MSSNIDNSIDNFVVNMENSIDNVVVTKTNNSETVYKSDESDN